MPIFFLSKKPEECAKWICDRDLFHTIDNCKYVISRYLQSCDDSLIEKHILFEPQFYELISADIIINWMKKNKLNFMWMVQLCLELCSEYIRRIWSANIDFIMSIVENINIIQKKVLNADHRTNYGIVTEFPIECVPEHCKISSNVIVCYQFYYIHLNNGMMIWTNCEAPSWYNILKRSRNGKIPRSSAKRSYRHHDFSFTEEKSLLLDDDQQDQTKTKKRNATERYVRCFDIKKGRGRDDNIIHIWNPPESLETDPLVVTVPI